MLKVNLLVEGLRLDSLAMLPPAFGVILAGPGVLGGVTTDNLGTSSSIEDGIDAILLLCDCELGEVGEVGDSGGRGTVGVGAEGEDENQPRVASRWAGICWGVEGCGCGSGVRAIGAS